MNLLILTLCVLIKMIMIITAGRLPSPTTPNLQQYVAYTFTTPRYHPTTTLRNTRLSKSLYNYTYNTDTGIQAQEDGHFHDIDSDQKTFEAQGSYNYTDNEGNTFNVSYIANEKGFQPKGAHLPMVPLLIKKSLEFIAKHPEKNESKISIH